MTGSIVRCDNSGLGTLAREFYENGIIQKVLIYPNGVYADFPRRFRDPHITRQLNDNDIVWLLDGIDKLLLFETPFRWDILKIAKQLGIRTIIMAMHEAVPDPPPENPDLWLAPSMLEMELPIHPKKQINVPINTGRIVWKRRNRARVFLHNAGHGGTDFRNGTLELLQAMRYVKSPIKLIIRSQYHKFVSDDPRVEIRHENLEDYWDLWNVKADVFIFPEKFNGLSLPIQEAFASGMAVMATDRKPFNQWLPKELLIKPEGFVKLRIAREIEFAKISPVDIAKKIDEWYDKDISKFSLAGKKWAEENSWFRLRKEYEEL